MQQKPLFTLATLALCVGLTTLSACAGHPPATPLSSVTLPGEIALPLDADGERWLSVGELSGIQVLDAAYRSLSHWDRTAEFLDSRTVTAEGYQRTLFASFDTAQNRVLLYSISAAETALQQEFVSETIPYPVEGLCLHKDPQSRLHLFLLSELYEAHQYLLIPQGQNPDQNQRPWQLLPLRTLPTGPGTEFCATLDSDELLLTNEAGQTLWAYSTRPEAEVEREPVDLAAPFGHLGDGPLGMASTGEQVFVLTDDGPRLHRFQMQDDELRRSERSLAGADMGSAETIHVAAYDEEITLSLYDEDKRHFVLTREAGSPKRERPAPLPEVIPSAETSPMPQFGDAADDPALWINPQDPSQSLIIGTNKRQGLFVYDLQGRERQRLDVGRMNNVDVRYGARWQGRDVDIAVASNRDLNTLAAFAIDRTSGQVTLVDNLPTSLDNIYGLCMYQSPDSRLFVFANDEDGRFAQYRIETGDTGWRATEVRRFSVPSQPEGCVADDARARLYLGEEDVGIWTLGANPEDDTAMQVFARVGKELHDDVEGLALYIKGDHPYLLASSQGNDSYVLFDTAPPYQVLGAFRIGMNLDSGAMIDGASETDGLEIISSNLGGIYGAGLLIVQDGRNVLPQQPQNFKLVPWSAVETLFPSR